MNNYDRFRDALEFCALSPVCKRCPYSLFRNLYQDAPNKPCFESKENLEALEQWLHGEEDDLTEEFLGDDHTWLQDLIKLQFNEDDEFEL